MFGSDLKTMKVCIFCSANNNIDKRYFDAAREIGQFLGRNGHTLVFGGCDMGLMGALAESTKKSGGHTIGVVPTIIEKGGKMSPHLDVHIPCDNLSDRKDLLIAHADAIVAMPGGIGTLDEIFTVMAAASIGYHNKRVILLNIDGFWQSLIDMLRDLELQGMLREGFHSTIAVANSVEEMERMLNVEF